MNFTKINLGCGSDYINGWCNVDTGNCKKDVTWDLEVFPWPIPSDVASVIKAAHLLEHIKKENVISFMREVHRALKVGGIVEIYCPHYTSKNAFTDFTHQYFVTEDTFSYFCRDGKHRNFGTIYGIDFEFKEQHCGPYKESPESNLDIYFRLEKV